MKLSTIKQYHLAIAVAALCLAAGAHLAIEKSGGYDWTNTPVYIALAMAVFVGSLVAADAFKSSATAAAILVAGLVANEAFNLGTTSEATLTMRAEATAPIRAKAKARQDAEKTLAALEASEPSTARLALAKSALGDAKAGNKTEAVTIAEAAVKAAKADVEREAKNIACKKECWRLQDLADAAQRNLDNALKDAEAQRGQRIASAEAEVQNALAEAVALRLANISKAKAAVEAAEPPSVSPTVFADTIGWASWLVDLLFAGARSLALNLSAAGLLGYAARKMSEDSDLARVRTMMAGELPDVNGPTVKSVIGRKPQLALVQSVGQSGGQSQRRAGGNGGPAGGGNAPKAPKPSPTGPSGNAVKVAVFDDVMQAILDKRPIESQQSIANRTGVAKTTVSDWMREWQDAGLIPRAKRVGRCNRYEAAN